ncbi:MAG: EamA family transporter [Nanoarchaeota archaeon]
METKPLAILIVIISTFFTATGQFLFKMGAERLPQNLFDIVAYLSNWQLMLGLVFYGVAFGMIITALRAGELSVLYPFISLGFVWVTAVSVLLLNEPFTISKGGGILLIFLGVSCIGWGSRASAQA